MTGAVAWGELVAVASAIVTIVLAVSGFACWLLWKAWSELAKTRHTINSRIEQARVVLEDKVADLEAHLDDKVGGIDQRVRKLELDNVASQLLRDDVRSMRAGIDKKFDDLRDERRQDMRGLHARLNDLLMIPRPADNPAKTE